MIKRAISIIVICALLTVPGMIFAQQKAEEHKTQHPGEAQPQVKSSQEQEKSREQMMQERRTMHEQMTQKMQEMDARLDQKIAAMNAATGEKEQIEAMKAVINEMASQRKEMMDKMKGMHGNMPYMMEQRQLPSKE
jgi:hypothetical protein